jgi:hypothetical protein
VRRTRLLLATAIAGLALAGTAAIALAQPGTETGPSSSQSPYVVRSEPGVGTTSILTVGDSVNDKPDGTPYRMVGIPDGLGAFDNGDGTFTVLMNHEIPAGMGVPRAHRANGAFVSKWTIRKDDLEVLHGEDLIQKVATWNSGTSAYNEPALGVALARLCSADLAPVSAFFNAASGKGYDGRIYANGEEVGNEGRGFGHLMNGESYELPAVGKMSFENIVANPDTGDRTVAVELDDSTPGQVYVYAGNKQTTGSNPVEQAGLNNGRLYGIQVDAVATEQNADGIPSGTAFKAFDFGDVRNTSGTTLNDTSNANGVTNFQRPEDGAWDPNDPSKFYFVTTASATTNSRLWRLNFNDPADPAAGGTIDMLLDGSEGHRMLDNMTVNDRGQVIMQEDVGGNPRLSKIWVYDIAGDELTEVAEHDPNRFLTGGSEFLTQDEESSGIIPAPFLGEGKYLLDVQAHYSISGELVEGGQLLQLQIPPGKKF